MCAFLFYRKNGPLLDQFQFRRGIADRIVVYPVTHKTAPFGATNYNESQ